MSVYVDDVRSYPLAMIQKAAQRHGHKWCHMWADSESELIAFSEKIGMKRQWLQHEGTRHAHFDLVPMRRWFAVREGAIQMSRREYLRSLSRK